MIRLMTFDSAYWFGLCVWCNELRCWALLGPFIWGPVGAIHLLGPVGPIHLLGPAGAIHLGPGPGPIHFQSFLMKSDILGHLLFRRSFFDSILELCRTRRKRLYVLQEINPRWLQMKKCIFMRNWGWDQKHQVNVMFFIVKVKFLKKRWKKEDQCTSIFHFADRP